MKGINVVSPGQPQAGGFAVTVNPLDLAVAHRGVARSGILETDSELIYKVGNTVAVLDGLEVRVQTVVNRHAYDVVVRKPVDDDVGR